MFNYVVFFGRTNSRFFALKKHALAFCEEQRGRLYPLF